MTNEQIGALLSRAGAAAGTFGALLPGAPGLVVGIAGAAVALAGDVVRGAAASGTPIDRVTSPDELRAAMHRHWAAEIAEAGRR